MKTKLLALLVFLPAFVMAQVYAPFYSQTTLGTVAIALDTTQGAARFVTSQTTITVGYAPHGGSNEIALAALMIRDNSTFCMGDSVKFKTLGTSFTRKDSMAANTTTKSGDKVELWYLLNPPSTADSIVFYFHPANIPAIAGYSVWSGVHQTTPFGTLVKATGNNTAATVTVTSQTGDVVIDVMGLFYGDPTVTNSGTLLWKKTSADNAQVPDGGQQYKAGATSVTMNWTVSSDYWAIMAVPLKQANQ